MHHCARAQAAVSDPEVESLLEARIAEFSAAIEKRPPAEMVQVGVSGRGCVRAGTRAAECAAAGAAA